MGPIASKEVKRTTRGQVHLATPLGDNGVLGHLPNTWPHEKTDLPLHVADKVRRRMCCTCCYQIGHVRRVI